MKKPTRRNVFLPAKLNMLLIALLMCSALSAQLTTVGGGSWQSYNAGGTPPGFPLSTSVLNWGAPGAGSPTAWQVSFLTGAGTPPFVTGANINNFIWNNMPGSSASYYRLLFNRTASSCNKLKILCAGDEEIKVYINGTQIVNGTNPWVAYEVDITPYLICGQNILSARVLETTTAPSFFVCNMVSAGSVSLSGQAAYNTGLKCDDDLLLTAPSLAGATYTWSGPNSFTSTAQNPVIPDATTKHKGVYTCSVQLACCILTTSVNVTFENCDNCDANMTYTSDCDFYTFNLSSRFVDIKCSVFQIDNVTKTPTSGMLLSKGTHTVCYKYLGTRKSDPNAVCCSEVCTTVNVKGVETESINVSYCEMMPFQSGYVFKPCIPGGYAYYGLASPGTWPVMVPCSAQASHTLGVGTHTVDYFDAYFCQRKKLFITVTSVHPSMFYCSDTIRPACDSIVTPETVRPNPPGPTNGGCSCVLDAGDEIHEVVDWVSSDSNGNMIVYKTFYNVTKCTICQYIFTIIEKRCDFKVDFMYVSSTIDPLNYAFTKLSPDSVCSPDTWSFTDPMTGVQAPFTTSLSPQGNTVYVVHFPYEADWEICLTSCICVCPTPCCKTKCVTIGIHRLRMAPDAPFDTQLPQNNSHSELKGFMQQLLDDPAALQTEVLLVPNPSKGLFKLELKGKGSIDHYSVTDFNGREIIGKTPYHQGDMVDISTHANGVYTVKVSSGGKVLSVTCVKTE